MANRALLVGINKYQIPGADLRGCVNDVKNMVGVLTSVYKFPKGNVKTLLDKDATTSNMRKEMEKLVTKSKPGDVLYLHYSGHGSNVPDEDGDEEDERDEILCPTDLKWTDPLVDDWLRQVFDTVPKGVNFTVVFDCCHSGSATRLLQRDDTRSVPRYLACPWDLIDAESDRSLRGNIRSALRTQPAATTRGAKDIVTTDIPEVLITGCRADQTSADAFIGGTYNGALTYHLVKTIKDKKGKLTYRELHEGASKLLRGKYSQIPQLEGRGENLDREFLAPM